MPQVIYPTQQAWIDHIRPFLDTNWFNASTAVSNDLPISKRELFGLIILALLFSGDGQIWQIGYDSDQSEPNDGLISNGQRIWRLEHKTIVMAGRQGEVLDEIKATYERYQAKGANYGKDRMLMIHANKPSSHGGLVPIHELARQIGNESHFEKVVTMSKVNDAQEPWVMHVVQHYPHEPSQRFCIGEVRFDWRTGEGEVLPAVLDAMRTIRS